MKTLKKILKVLTENFLYALVLLAAIILFAWFSNGLIYGLISAFSLLIAYICADRLYKEFKKGSKK